MERVYEELACSRTTISSVSFDLARPWEMPPLSVLTRRELSPRTR
jgi:hypothetical protein